MREINSNKKIPGSVLKYTHSNNDLFFETADCILIISVLSEKVLRFRYTPELIIEREFSYAVSGSYAEGCWHTIEENIDNFILATSSLRCIITKKGLLLRIEDLNENVILEDEKGFHWEDNQDYGGNIVYCSKEIQTAEVFLGLGDKPTDLDLRGKLLNNWGSDMFGFEKNSDPLYKNIPFFYGLHHGLAYGIFLDNTYKSTFDFGCFNHNVMSFWADGGPMDYYFMYGPELLSVAKEYTKLTGLPQLPPIWSLGFHQSRWSYSPDSKVVEIADQFRKNEIPCDAIYLDIDYMNGYRCFTWDDETFPDPLRTITNLSDKGFHTVAIIDPGIKIDLQYQVYNEALQRGYFCRRGDGPLMKGNVWPGECNFPDFTNPEVRSWWGMLFIELTNKGVSGIWNDMNEPAVFGIHTFPNDVRHNFDGLECSHRKAHNIYGMQMARATYEGLLTLLPEKRLFTITRSGFSGVQRYSAVWTGDNLSTWEHLWLANIQCQRLSISGLSFCGSDIGGFIGSPDGELFTRWIQLAVFHPLMRAHSSKDYEEKEPWVYVGIFQPIIKRYIELRYQLLPYIYTAMWEYVTDGTPVIKSLCFLDQGNMHTYYRKEEFLVGDHILACPVSAPGIESRILFLPKGTWFNYFTDDYYEGNREIITYCPIDICPVFIRGGAVIPTFPPIQHTGEISKIEILTLHVYYSDQLCESSLYEDAGEGYDYFNGNYKQKHFFTYSFNEEFALEQSEFGNFKATYLEYEIVVHGLPFMPEFVDIDHYKPELKREVERNICRFNAPVNFGKIKIIPSHRS